MKTSPILFNTEMVQALLEGRKTQTRRTIKYKKEIQDPKIGFTAFTPDNHFSVRGTHKSGEYGESFFKLQIQKGDILWIRETWSLSGWDWQSGDISIQYKDGKIVTHDPDELTDGTQVSDWLLRKTDKLQQQGCLKKDPEDEEMLIPIKTKWEPSIFMPKWACRLWLEVTDVRAERLQDISEADAVAEGIKLLGLNGYDHKIYKNYPSKGAFENGLESPVQSFFSLWESINGKASLDANPWVWVYTFKKCEMPKNFLS